MIPLRVKVQGFLSYRDEACLEFDGASLWMLTGANGAGKSAIFDAVTFALYGAHRGGKQNADKLINQSRDHLLVEFDFRLGEDVYRARRTENKRGQPTRGIIHLAGPNPPPHGDNASAMEPSTDTRAGFDNWIATHIGLSYEAFKASVLLRQGESDALLKMDSRERHNLLTQLVDLSRYVQLSERAKSKLDENSSRERLAADRLQTLPSISAQAITDLASQSEASRKISAAAQMELQNIVELKVQAQHWQANQKRLAAVEADLANARLILSRAPVIEQAVQRVAELAISLPILDRLLDARRRQADARANLTRSQVKLDELTRDKQTLENERAKYANELESLLSTKDGTNSALHRQQNRRNELAPAQEQLKRLADVAAQVAELDKALAAFPADLDEQAHAANQTVEQLNDLKSNLGELHQIHESRKEIDSILKSIERSEVQQLKLAEQAKSLAGEEKVLRTQMGRAEKERAVTQRSLAQAATGLEDLETRLTNLGKLGHATTCTHCGQKLAPGHLQQERGNLTKALAEARTIQRAAQKADKEAEANISRLTESIRDLEKRIRANTRQIDATSDALTGHQTALQTARQRSQTALKRLPRELRAKVESGYPTTADLQKLETEIGALKAAQTQQKRLVDRVRERDAKIAERKSPAREFARLSATYSPEGVQAIQAELMAITTAIGKLQADLEKQTFNFKRLDAKAKEAEKQNQQLESVLSDTEKAHAAAQALLTQAEGDERQAATQAAQTLVGEVHEVNDAQVEALHTEHRQVHAVAQEADKLQAARQTEIHLQNEQANLISEIAKTPPEAQHEPKHFEALMHAAQNRQEEADRSYRDAAGQRLSLEAKRAEREQVEKEHLDAARLAKRYKTLSNVLGRDGLQRHLLEQVECEIIENTNAVLDKVSGGMLWLELQSESNGKDSKNKALDLIAHNRANGADGIGVDYLSGSQRFRTAVSLALGIGQYASRDSHRVEAVIIDEGFGSLDKKGRDEMIDELRNLKDTLSRIILVSHQDEFTQAFPNRYLVSLNDGNSTVCLEVDN